MTATVVATLLTKHVACGKFAKFANVTACDCARLWPNGTLSVYIADAYDALAENAAVSEFKVTAFTAGAVVVAVVTTWFTSGSR